MDYEPVSDELLSDYRFLVLNSKLSVYYDKQVRISISKAARDYLKGKLMEIGKNAAYGTCLESSIQISEVSLGVKYNMKQKLGMVK